MKLTNIRVAFSLTVAFSLLSGCSTEKLEHITTPKGLEYIENGKNLTRGMAACGFCHGAKPDPDAALSGGQHYSDLYGETKAPNITPTQGGLGQWNNDQIFNYFRFGLNQDGEETSQIPHRGMEWMADDDLLAIIAYIRSLPPLKHKTPVSRVLTFVDRNTSGFFEGRREVAGFVPSIPKKSTTRYGQYLVENVAACGRCHNSPDSLFNSGGFLSGGTVVRNEHGEKKAPNITNSATEGIGNWSEDMILAYLKEGKRPSGATADARFCPIGFYRNAPEQDLRSVAQFLRTVTPD